MEECVANKSIFLDPCITVEECVAENVNFLDLYITAEEYVAKDVIFDPCITAEDCVAKKFYFWTHALQPRNMLPIYYLFGPMHYSGGMCS